MSIMMNTSTPQYHSRGIATAVADRVTEGSNILDLGPLSSGTAECFLGVKCKCYVEDLVEYLELASSDDPDAVKKLGDHLLPKPASLKFDAVLCWDIFNFLELDAIEFLMARLNPHFKSGTVLHTIHYVGSQQPGTPRCFELLEDFTYRTTGDAYRVQITSKSHSTAALIKPMKQFSLRNTLANQEGMPQNITEMILEFDPQPG